MALDASSLQANRCGGERQTGITTREAAGRRIIRACHHTAGRLLLANFFSTRSKQPTPTVWPLLPCPRFASFRRPYLLLFLPTLVYAAATVFAHYRGDDPPTGDEPMYLLAAESLVDDFDPDLKNNLQKLGSQAVRNYESLRVVRPHGWFSVHSLGLPALISLPWALCGALGARLAIALCCGLTAPLLYQVISEVWPNRHGALLLALAFALGMPLAHAASQIYPDLPAGILLLFLVGRVLTAKIEAATIGWRDLPASAALAFLPWLHIKYAAPALVVFGWQALAGGWKRSSLNAVALGASLALLGWYNWYAFGKPSGPYEGSTALVAGLNGFIVFMGLHFDQAQGMFLQQPLWLLGLVGLAPMWRSSPRTCVCWLLLYLASIVPNALHPNWYGGGSFIGRFGATAVLLWSVPLAHAARSLAEIDRRAPAVLAILSLTLQLALTGNWLTAGQGLLNQDRSVELWRPCVWAYHGFYPYALRDYLPYWQPATDFWRYPANLSAVVAAGGLLAGGLFLPLRPKPALRCLLWPALGAVLLTAAVPVEQATAVCRGDHLFRFPGLTGHTVGTWQVAKEGAHAAGPLALAHGFYPRPGNYRILVDYQAHGATEPVGQVLFHNGKNLAALSTLSGEDGLRRNVNLLHVPRADAGQPSFIMVWYTGHGTLSVARLAVECCDR